MIISILVLFLIVSVGCCVFFNYLTGMKIWTMTLLDLSGICALTFILFTVFLASYIWPLGLVCVILLYVIIRIINKRKLPSLIEPIIGGRKD